MNLFEMRKYIKERCPKCGGKLYYRLNELLMVKLSAEKATVTIHCEKCSFQEKREISID